MRSLSLSIAARRRQDFNQAKASGRKTYVMPPSKSILYIMLLNGIELTEQRLETSMMDSFRCCKEGMEAVRESLHDRAKIIPRSAAHLSELRLLATAELRSLADKAFSTVSNGVYDLAAGPTTRVSSAGHWDQASSLIGKA